MAIILGLITALCWGAGDFLARSIAQRLGSYRALLLVQLIGGAALSAYLLLSGELARLIGAAPHSVWAWAVLAALLNLTGSLFLYRSFEVGVLALVSPIGSSYAAITAALSLLSGETVGRSQGLGMALTLLGVILAVGAQGQPPDAPPAQVHAGAPRDARQGVICALIAAVGYGLAFWVLGYHVTGQLGGTAPVWVVRLVTIATLAVLAAPLRQNLRLPRSVGLWAPIAVVGLLDTGGYVAFAHGMHGDQIAVVGVLSSLFSAVTVLLSWLIARERLAARQWLGIMVIFVGVALVSA